jgi:RNA-splicing ligase RtcB
MFEIVGKYTKAIVYNDNIEDEAVAQIYGIVNCKAYEGQTIRIMPDTHCGKGSVIGFCSTFGKYIDPRTVGVDVGCEISMHLYDRPVPADKYAELNHKILKECGWGFNLSPKKMYEDKELYKFMSTEFRKAKSRHPESFAELPDTVTEKWVMDMLNRLGMDPKTWYYSINSFGGGNHYCEYDVNEENNLYGITVHCGSRNFGVKVCKYWENKSKGAALSKSEVKEYTDLFKKKYIEEHGRKNMEGFKDALKKYLDSRTEGHIEGFLTGDNMLGYFCDMYTARTYARFNHIILHRTIDKIVAKYGCKVIKEIVSTHNYIDFDEDIPIIRKGAIRAYEGEEMLVPFNMRDGVAVCEGLSNSEWLNSCAHGAGRKMSRSKAKENVSMEEFKESMKDVYSTTVCKGTIDESPMAYKDTNEIKELIQETCKIKFMMIPKINIKAADGGD